MALTKLHLDIFKITPKTISPYFRLYENHRTGDSILGNFIQWKPSSNIAEKINIEFSVKDRDFVFAYYCEKLDIIEIHHYVDNNSNTPKNLVINNSSGTVGCSINCTRIVFIGHKKADIDLSDRDNWEKIVCLDSNIQPDVKKGSILVGG